MLIVLVIIGIALAMIIPKLSGVVGVSSIQGALNRVATDIAYTRIQAIRNGQRGQLVVDSDGHGYSVITDPNGVNRKVWKTENLELDYPDLVLSPGPATISFDSRGILVNGSTTTISATRQGRTDSLTISLVGRVYRDY